MKIVNIFNGFVYKDYSNSLKSLDEAKKKYANNMIFVEAPDYVFEGWGYDETKIGDERFTKPIPPEGFLYDEDTGTYYKDLSNKEKRKDFYIYGKSMKEKNEFFVIIDDEKYTVEEATNLGKSYEYRDEVEKSNEIKKLVKSTVKEIRERYPD